MAAMMAIDFSAKTRLANLAKSKDEWFDILVVGGGITGAGIARDAALRGYKVALVDKGDFASGASSKSSKLVHGGIRYLELFEFGLVFEASRERRILWEIAPDLVRPLPFLFPVYRDARWPAWMIDMGLWMYDGLSLFRNFKRHRMYSNAQISRVMRGFDTRNTAGGAHYYDAQVDDARLTLESIRAAHRHGAVVANYAQVDALLKDQGRVVGVQGHDVLCGQRFQLHARVVVNATGPWTDSLTQLDDPHSPRRLRPTKGVHILVPRDKVGGESAVTFPAQSDGRLMFVIPWAQFSIVGTTDTDFQGDYDRVYANAADVDYVIAAVNHAFPQSAIQKSDVISAYAGLRPLVLQEGKSATKTSREHEIWTTESGLLNIAGGKLTTYRAMAQELVDAAAKILREGFDIAPARTCLTARTGLIEGYGAVSPDGLSDEVITHLRHVHGPQYGRVLQVANRDPRLKLPIIEGLPYIWAEIPYAIENEMALTVADVLSRRTHILTEATDNGLGAAPEVAARLGESLDWDKSKIEQELRAYQDEVARARAFR
ncbi:MAG: glycerol-3-phosphate dehydrogenase/oxidase [Chloroflexi bacterium]|nr:glycerol-3-phosphate dehydrogenase/oxidase [Chloroflexota bacterium]